MRLSLCLYLLRESFRALHEAPGAAVPGAAVEHIPVLGVMPHHAPELLLEDAAVVVVAGCFG